MEERWNTGRTTRLAQRTTARREANNITVATMPGSNGKRIFSKLSQYGYDGWAVLEWECAIKSAEQGAAEGAPFIESHIINVTEKAFDDFAASGTDLAANRRILGLDR